MFFYCFFVVMLMRISIVIPLYNSEKTIVSLIEEIFRVNVERDIKIFFVNDGSVDDTHKICCDLVDKYPLKIVYIDLAKNFGEHNAVMAALNHVDGDYAIIMDDDFQNPPKELPRLIEEAISKKYDILYTFSRRKSHSRFRNFASRISNRIADIVLQKPAGLYLSSFKCLSRLIVNEIIKYDGPYPYIDGLALRYTNNIGRIEVSHERSKKSKSSYTLRKLIGLWLSMFVNFSIFPQRIILLTGVVFFFAGILAVLIIFLVKMFLLITMSVWSFLVAFLIVLSLLTINQAPQFVIRGIYKS